jgi:hypothetical protein
VGQIERYQRHELAEIRRIETRRAQAIREVDEQVRTEVARVAALKASVAPLDALPTDMPPVLRSMARRVALSSIAMIRRL